MELDEDSDIESLSEYYQVPLPQCLIKKSQLHKINFDCLNARHGTTLNPSRVKTWKKVIMSHQDATRTILQHLQQETDLFVLSQQTGLSLARILKEMKRLFATRLSSLLQMGKDRKILIVKDIPIKLMHKAAHTIVQLNRIVSIKNLYPLIWNYMVIKNRDALGTMSVEELKVYCRELVDMLALLRIHKQPSTQVVINVDEQQHTETVNNTQEGMMIKSPTITSKTPFKPNRGVQNQIIYLSQDEQIMQSPPLQFKLSSPEVNMASNQTSLNNLSHPSGLKTPCNNLNMSIVKQTLKRLGCRFPPHQDRGADFTGFRNIQFPRITLRNTLAKIINGIVYGGAETMQQSCLHNNVDYNALMSKVQQIRGKSLSALSLQEFFDSLSIMEKKVFFEEFVVQAVQNYPRYVKVRGRMDPALKKLHIQTALRVAKIIVYYYKKEISSQLPERILKLHLQLGPQEKNTNDRQSSFGNLEQSMQVNAESMSAPYDKCPHLIIKDQ